MYENMVFFVLLFIFNILFMIKRIPIFAIPFGIITFFIGAVYYLPLGEFNALFSFLLIFVGVMGLFINALFLRKK